jgi:hypothetical protein
VTGYSVEVSKIPHGGQRFVAGGRENDAEVSFGIEPDVTPLRQKNGGLR